MTKSPLLQFDLSAVIHAHDQQHAAIRSQEGAYYALKQQLEAAFFYHLLYYTHGNKHRAARIAGIDAGTLNRKLHQYCIRIETHIISPAPRRRQP